MIITGLSLALIAVWLVEDLAMPHWLNYYTKKNWFHRKPFNCALCLGFWFGVITSLVLQDYILLAPVTSALAVLIQQFKHLIS